MIKFKLTDFNNSDDAVKLSDDEVERLINTVVRELENARSVKKDDPDFSFSGTGDTMVFGFYWPDCDEDEIELYVCRGYREAKGWVKKDGSFEKLEWEEWEEDKPNASIKSIAYSAPASLCPVCNGKGFVSAGFYSGVGNTWISTGGTEICRSCFGKGYVK